MNKAEKELLIQIITNIDDLIKELTATQYLKFRKNINKIKGNYHNLLEGVKK